MPTRLVLVFGEGSRHGPTERPGTSIGALALMAPFTKAVGGIQTRPVVQGHRAAPGGAQVQAHCGASGGAGASGRPHSGGLL